MPPDRHDYGPIHRGSYVVLRPIGDEIYQVAVEPPLPTGVGAARSYGSKHEAWGEARWLWQSLKLPFRDMTVCQTARSHDD